MLFTVIRNRLHVIPALVVNYTVGHDSRIISSSIKDHDGGSNKTKTMTVYKLINALL